MKKQAGFTLVELAIVLMVIGLLIGGVLKGAEMIGNAQISGTIAQTKDYASAMTTFRDAYSAWPGDLPSPSSKVPGCSALPCSYEGNGNREVGNLNNGLGSEEQRGFWGQLGAAGFISGVTPNSEDNIEYWGNVYPEAKIGGGFEVGYWSGGSTLPGANSGGETPAGHYLFLHGAPVETMDGGALTAAEAQQIDKKLDDGSPVSGSVYANGSNCTWGDGGWQYAVGEGATQSPGCFMYLRIND